MPSSRQARMMRRAISPRLEIRTFLNIPCTLSPSTCSGQAPRGAKPQGPVPRRRTSGPSLRPSRRLNAEQRLPELDRLGVLDEDLGDLAGHFGLDLVHQLHRLDDAQDLALAHARADLDVRRLVGSGRAVER